VKIPRWGFNSLTTGEVTSSLEKVGVAPEQYNHPLSVLPPLVGSACWGGVGKKKERKR